MVTEIRLYIEGDPALRPGFSKFLRKGIGDDLDQQHVKLRPILCGNIDDTWKKFYQEWTADAEVAHLLLVDADAKVTGQPRQHLHPKHSWMPEGSEDRSYHLMVQMMEAWFVADPDALAVYYGKGFDDRELRRRRDVETYSKEDLEKILADATANTKNRWSDKNKLRHAIDLLQKIDPQKVRRRAHHCDQLLGALAGLIAASGQS